MPFPRFLLDSALDGPGEYVLNQQESHHAVGVFRLRAGDAVIVFDGKGNRSEAIVAAADRDATRVRVDSIQTERHLSVNLTIATAIPKGKRWQILVEKCTELGVDRIIPMLTERSVAKGEGDIGKWRRWIAEAAKQSRRAWIPEIVEPMPMTEIAALANPEQALLLVADASGDTPASYRDPLSRAARVIVMVGPEGGFTAAELDACADHGACRIRLSPFVLRIETAAASVCAIIREMDV